MDERLLRTILLLKEKTKNKLMLKTKHADLPLLSYIQNEDLEEFHKDRIQKRKQFGYSPFNVLVKITVTGKKERLAREVDFIKEILKDWKPVVFPAFIRTVRNQLIMHILIRIPKNDWPNSDLLYTLRNFSPSVAVNVDPQTLL
jgi:primosomal protein N'